MPNSTKSIELDLPSGLVATLTTATATASPEPVELIARFYLAQWISDLQVDSPEHVEWIASFARTLLAFPDLLPGRYRWPMEMLAEMNPG